MRKKKNILSRVPDLIVTLICLLGAFWSVRLFWADLNTTLSKLREVPVGTVTFKQRTAQRRFSDRVIWDRLRRTSPVYNGDTIRLADLSEAVITFRGEERLELLENTLVQIFYSEDEGIIVDIAGGNLTIEGRGVINSGNSRARIEGETSVRADGEGFEIRAEEGSAVITGGGGETWKLDTGSALAFTLEGNPRPPDPPDEGDDRDRGETAAVVIDLSQTADTLTVSPLPVTVTPPAPAPATAAVPEAPRTARTVVPPAQAAEARAVVPVPAVAAVPPVTEVPAAAESAETSAARTVLPSLPPPQNPSPGANAVIGPAQLGGRSLVFTWQNVEGANGYIVSLYRVEGGRSVRVLSSAPQSANSYLLDDLSLLDRGAFTWHVEAVYADETGVLLRRGETRDTRFTVDLPRPSKPGLGDPGTLYGN
jgi:hypothetical protein